MAWGFLGKLIGPVTSFLGKRSDRKQAKETATAKLQMAKVTGKQDLQMTDAEWEAMSLATQNDSYKDEYLTVVITSPILLIIVGSVYGAWTGDPRIMDGTLAALAALKDLGIDMGELMYVVVLAGVGLKVWRGRG